MVKKNIAQQHEQSVSPFRETILIADDDSHIRDIVRFSLNKGGYRTCEAGDGRRCLEACDEYDPDLIILDILMPEMMAPRCAKKFEEDLPCRSSFSPQRTMRSTGLLALNSGVTII